MKRVAVLLADGFEEVEAITPIDFLRRAGVEVVTAGIASKRVQGSHAITIEADTTIGELAGDLDAVILPGGTVGASNLAKAKAVSALVQRLHGEGRLVGAICAAPAKVLGPTGILAGRRATCYPGLEGELEGARFSEERVVRDGNLITSRGAGTAGEFAVELVRYLAGPEAADTVRQSVLQR